MIRKSTADYVQVTDQDEAVVMRIMEGRRGHESAVSQVELIRLLAMVGYHFDDRKVRAVVNSLRKKGVELCSSGGSAGGYWLAKDGRELTEYIDSMLSVMKDYAVQVKALRATRVRKYSQDTLF